MDGTNVYEQLEQEQHTIETLHKRLCKSYNKLNRRNQQLDSARNAIREYEEHLESARSAIRAYEEHFSEDKQMRVITEQWEQLQDAHALAQQRQSEQQLRAAQADSLLAETREQLRAEKAGQAAAISLYEEVLQCQAAAAQESQNAKQGLQGEVEMLKQQLAASAGHQSDLQKELQTAQQQSNAAAHLSADNTALRASLQAAQQQLASVSAARDAHNAQLTAAQQQGQEWASQRDQAHSLTLKQADRILTLTNENMALMDAAEKAEAHWKEIVQQATGGLTAQLAEAQAEAAELRHTSAAAISNLQSQLQDSPRIGALHTARKPKASAHISCQEKKAVVAAKPAIPQVAGRSAASQASSRRAVAGSRAAAEAQQAPARRKQTSRSQAAKQVSWAHLSLAAIESAQSPYCKTTGCLQCYAAQVLQLDLSNLTSRIDRRCVTSGMLELVCF